MQFGFPVSIVRTSTWLAGVALGAALVVFAPACGRAATVTYIASGSVLHVSPDLAGQFPVGQDATFTFTFDAGIPDSDPNPAHGSYPNGLVSSSGSIGSYHFTAVAGILDVTNAAEDVVLAFSHASGPDVGDDKLFQATILLMDTSGDALSSDAVPVSLDLAAFNGLDKLNLLFARPDNTIDEVIVPIAELALLPMSPVPVPAALPLFASGLGAIGFLAWRRKRKIAAAGAAA